MPHIRKKIFLAISGLTLQGNKAVTLSVTLMINKTKGIPLMDTAQHSECETDTQVNITF